jgi:signal transduction histidine kinase
MSEITDSDLVVNAQQYQTIVQHGSKRFLRFMNDLIELSLLEAGESLELFYDWFSPDDLFNEMVTQLEEELFDNKIKADITIAVDQSLMVYSDVARVKQVMTHMLDMMVYHPGKDSSITLGAFRDTINRNVVLYIRNDSIILEKYQSEIITTAFHKSEKKGSCDFDFRLDLVHRIVEKIGCTCKMQIDDSSRISVYVTLEDKQENVPN